MVSTADVTSIEYIVTVTVPQELNLSPLYMYMVLFQLEALLKHGCNFKVCQNIDTTDIQCWFVSDVPSASERRRTLSMQSYTLEEPSQALLNSTLNECNRTPDIKNPDKMETTPKATPSSAKSTHTKQSAKSKIPTLQACGATCPPTNTSTPVIHSRPSTGQKKKHVLVQRILEESLGMRPLTPSPPERAMTPTPPDRPKSEMGTRCSRSKARYKIATESGRQ